MTEAEALEWAIWLIKCTPVMKADWPKKGQCLKTLEAMQRHVEMQASEPDYSKNHAQD